MKHIASFIDFFDSVTKMKYLGPASDEFTETIESFAFAVNSLPIIITGNGELEVDVKESVELLKSGLINAPFENLVFFPNDAKTFVYCSKLFDKIVFITFNFDDEPNPKNYDITIANFNINNMTMNHLTFGYSIMRDNKTKCFGMIKSDDFKNFGVYEDIKKRNESCLATYFIICEKNSTKGIEKERKDFSSTNRMRRLMGKRPLPEVIEFTNKYVYDKKGNKHELNHSSPRPHWRKGHYKNVACGVGRLERKRVFIQACLVNFKPNETKDAAPKPQIRVLH